MKIKSYHILYRLLAFLADKTNGFSFFVKYKLALGTLILSVSAASCAKKQSAQENVDDENMRDTIDHIKNYISCYRIVPLPDSVNEEEDIPFVTPIIGSDSLLVDKPRILCYAPIVVVLDDSLVPPPSTNMIIGISEPLEIPPDQKIHFYGTVEQPPAFQGGALFDFVNWIQANMDQSVVAQFQEEGIEGRLVVSFVVNEKGEVIDIITLRSVSPTIDNEVIRIIKRSPLWSVGKHLGENVDTKVIIAIRFPNKANTLK